jgi:hypothetical protein
LQSSIKGFCLLKYYSWPFYFSKLLF